MFIELNAWNGLFEFKCCVSSQVVELIRAWFATHVDLFQGTFTLIILFDIVELARAWFPNYVDVFLSTDAHILQWPFKSALTLTLKRFRGAYLCWIYTFVCDAEE